MKPALVLLLPFALTSALVTPENINQRDDALLNLDSRDSHKGGSSDYYGGGSGYGGDDDGDDDGNSGSPTAGNGGVSTGTTAGTVAPTASSGASSGATNTAGGTGSTETVPDGFLVVPPTGSVTNQGSTSGSSTTNNGAGTNSANKGAANFALGMGVLGCLALLNAA